MSKRNTFSSLLVLSLMIALISGCGGQTTMQGETAKAANSPQPQQQVSEWDQLVQKANQEGKLIVFGPANNEYRDKLIEGFNKQYPKIKIEYRSVTKGADVISKISSEKRAGVHELDILMFGSTTIYNDLIPAGYMSPVKDLLILEDFKDSSKWLKGKLEYSDNEEKYILPYMLIQGNQLLVNKNLVDVSKLKSYDDLLNPEFKGKIVVSDPKEVGQARYAFAFFYDTLGEDYIKKLAAQEPIVNKDPKQLIEWVAHGKYAIGISPGNSDAFQEYLDGGIPIQGMTLKEGGYYSPGYNNLSVLKDAPHPNATKLFVNWMFTKEAQELLAKVLNGNSVRTDVSSQLEFNSSKKYFAAHLQKSDDVGRKGIEAFNKYFKK